MACSMGRVPNFELVHLNTCCGSSVRSWLYGCKTVHKYLQLKPPGERWWYLKMDICMLRWLHACPAHLGAMLHGSKVFCRDGQLFLQDPSSSLLVCQLREQHPVLRSALCQSLAADPLGIVKATMQQLKLVLCFVPLPCHLRGRRLLQADAWPANVASGLQWQLLSLPCLNVSRSTVDAEAVAIRHFCLHPGHSNAR